ncbi:hypothetical protein H0H87_008004 [Tephrocybe sp. NHM501043]|nr:hypothetical protein H0H87_008004 [Tephrocybe sp. NHM501043]
MDHYLAAIKHKKAKTDVSEIMINKIMIDIDVDDDAQPVRSPILVFEKRICEEKAKLKKSCAPDIARRLARNFIAQQHAGLGLLFFFLFVFLSIFFFL